MCEKCIELDRKIEHYKAMRARITGKLMLTGLAELIAELIAKKAELHPEQAD